MQILKFNNEFIDIDKDTAIGLDIQSYDIKEPAERKVTTSNSFSIPKTANNLRVLGFPGNPQSTSALIYEFFKCEYWIDNIKIINGKAKIEEVAERIYISMYDRASIWDLLADIPFRDTEPYHGAASEKGLQTQILDWLIAERGYPGDLNPVSFNISNPREYDPDFEQFIKDYCTDDNGLIFTKGVTNLSNVYSDEAVVLHGQLEGFGPLGDGKTDRICFSWTGPFIEGDIRYSYIHGGNFAISVKTLFEFLEYKFPTFVWGTSNNYTYGNVTRYLYETNEEFESNTIFNKVYGSFEGNDLTLENTYIPLRNIRVSGYVTGPNEYNATAHIYFTSLTCKNNSDSTPLYGAFLGSSTDNKYCIDKTAYDLVKTILKQFNILIDPVHLVDISVTAPALTYFEMHLFNDLINAESDQTFFNSINNIKFKPHIDGWSQNNYITYDSVPNDITSLGSVNIKSNNKTLDIGEIDSPIYSIPTYTGLYTYYDDSERQNVLINDTASYANFYFLTKSSDIYYKGFKVYIYFKSDSYPNALETHSLHRTTLHGLEKKSVFITNNMIDYSMIANIMDKPVMYTLEKYMTVKDLYNLKFYKKYWIKELNGFFYINKIEGFNPQTNATTTFELIKIG